MTAEDKRFLKDFVEKYRLRPIGIFLLAAFAVLFIFQAGVTVGYRKADFIYRSSEGFHRVFDARRGPGEFFLFENVSGGHGAAGKIVSVNLPSFVVAGPDNIEKVIVTYPGTVVRSMRDTVSIKNLRVDDHVIVLGTPGQEGQVVAKLIRMMPPPPSLSE